MNEITENYGDDLDDFRKSEVDFDDTKVSLLMDCLENGINIFDLLEKKLFAKN